MKPLLICGMPASGKTTFGNWLRDQKGFLHLDLELRDSLPNHLPAREGIIWPDRIWKLPVSHSDFVRVLRDLGRPVVMTWAFHTDLIPFAGEMVEAGVIPWWFEADRLAARVKCRERGRLIKDGVIVPGVTDFAHLDDYVSTLVRRWTEIEPIMGGNILRTLDGNGVFLPSEKIYETIIEKIK